MTMTSRRILLGRLGLSVFIIGGWVALDGSARDAQDVGGRERVR